MNGVAIAMTGDGFKSVADIMDEHVAVGKSFYFSTSYRFDKKKVRQLDMVLFYNKAENVYYLGDITNIVSYGLNEDVPMDSEKYSPTAYVDIPMKNWILATNVKKVQLKDLHDLSFKGKAVDDLISNAKRGTKFYFTCQK